MNRHLSLLIFSVLMTGHTALGQPGSLATDPVIVAKLKKVHVQSAESRDKSIFVSIAYGGGCGSHEFHVIRSSKLCETNQEKPGHYVCRIEILDNTNDTCESVRFATLEIPLISLKLSGPSFSGQDIVIESDNYGGKAMEIRVTIP